MRCLVILVLVVGCGRIGFDSGAPSDGAVDPIAYACAPDVAQCHVIGASEPLAVACDDNAECHVLCPNAASCAVECGGSASCHVVCPTDHCTVTGCIGNACVVTCGFTEL